MVTKAVEEYLYLSYNEQQTLENLIQRLPSKYQFINRIVLYGSKSRGDQEKLEK